MPASAPAGFRGATIARQQLLRPYPHFGDINTHDERRRVLVPRAAVQPRAPASRAATRSTSAYTCSRFEEAIEFLNAGDPAPTRDDLGHGCAAPAVAQRHRGAAVRTGTPVRHERAPGRRHVHRRLADIRRSTSTRPACRSAVRQLHLSPVSSTTSRSRSSDRSLERWFNVDAFNRVTAQQLVSNVRTFPLRLDNVRDARDQQRRPVAHQEHDDHRTARRCSSGWRR